MNLLLLPRALIFTYQTLLFDGISIECETIKSNWAGVPCSVYIPMPFCIEGFYDGWFLRRLRAFLQQIK
eukprot:scaffold2004_cov101-Cylindrotheca_fusiformis.AAC.5